jgi:hypothetical protein
MILAIAIPCVSPTPIYDPFVLGIAGLFSNGVPVFYGTLQEIVVPHAPAESVVKP